MLSLDPLHSSLVPRHFHLALPTIYYPASTCDPTSSGLEVHFNPLAKTRENQWIKCLRIVGPASETMVELSGRGRRREECGSRCFNLVLVASGEILVILVAVVGIG